MPDKQPGPAVGDMGIASAWRHTAASHSWPATIRVPAKRKLRWFGGGGAANRLRQSSPM
jgi:hypothetical protein